MLLGAGAAAAHSSTGAALAGSTVTRAARSAEASFGSVIDSLLHPFDAGISLSLGNLSSGYQAVQVFFLEAQMFFGQLFHIGFLLIGKRPAETGAGADQIVFHPECVAAVHHLEFGVSLLCVR